jgi:hypothetical protein
VFRGFAVIASGLTVLAFACMALAVAALWRLRQESRLIEAAERFQAVDLTDVVKKYVPAELQSHRLSEEIPLAKAAIGARWPRHKWTAIVAAIVMLASAAAASILIHRNLRPEQQEAQETTRETSRPVVAKPQVSLDVLKTVQGVWGLKFDFLQSCDQNPQMIMVSPDRKKLLVHYVKPAADGTAVDINYDVVATQPNMLILANPADDTSNDKSTLVYMKFADADTYDMRTGDNPLAPTSVVVRCP